MSAKRQRSIRLTDVESFLRRIQEKCPFAMMFRGQARRRAYSYLAWDDILSPNWDMTNGACSTIISLRDSCAWAVRILSDIRKRLPRPLRVVAQHHGLPTRLLDTTTNPLKALYFAVNEPKDDAERGVVWAFEYRGYRTELKDEGAEYWENEICPFLSAQYTPRLTAQEGAFILCPVPKNTKPMRELNRVRQSDLSFTKVSIPKRYKAAIRRELSLY